MAGEDARLLDAGVAAATRDAATPPLAALDAASPSEVDSSLSATDADGGTTIPPQPDPSFEKPELLGTLAGPGTQARPAGVQLYGTDMGLSFTHDGKLYMLFGDTWARADSICGGTRPDNDDTLATLPLSLANTLPNVQFLTKPEAPEQLRNLFLYREQRSLALGYGQAPLAAFSDGKRSYALFGRFEPVSCAADAKPSCAANAGFECTDAVGSCEPPYLTFPIMCNAVSGEGCLAGQTCKPAALCVDPTSSSYGAGDYSGQAVSVVQAIELGAARSNAPDQYDSVLAWPTSKLSVPAARAIAKWSGQRAGNDYAPGHGELLVWGRPALSAEHGRQAQVYLMTHALPLDLDAKGQLRFAPQYFAGVDAKTGEPTWTTIEGEARPLALDGASGGDPMENVGVVGTMTMSWIGAPIDKWVMLYGGDLSDYLLLDPHATRGARSPGAIMIRFADHPWGPFSPEQPLLAPGSALQAGDPYGPGGFLYHPDCTSNADAPCAATDPHRPLDTALPGCLVSTVDPGRLYGPNIIDEYTKPNASGGVDMIWNVSTWNPYAVKLLRTRLVPAQLAAEPTGELADTGALRRLSQWRALPVLKSPQRYEQQSSHDRGTTDTTFPLSDHGNRDFNNFVCASADADFSKNQLAPLRFDHEQCAESYVHGVVLARFEGPGHMARMWLGMQSLVNAAADHEVLRIYADDVATPRVDVPLAQALDGRAGELFAPPFGAGSPARLAWYYPVTFRHKLIVALDHLGDYDEYFYHCDVVHDAPSDAPLPSAVATTERERAARQLNATFHPAGSLLGLHAAQHVALQPGELERIRLAGPATLHELSLIVAAADFPALADVNVRVRWDGASQPAIDLPLTELFGGRVAPERSSLALTGFVEGSLRTLVLKLPMPFAHDAHFTLENRGTRAVGFELRFAGEHRVPAAAFGRLHTVVHDTLGPTTAAAHTAIAVKGTGRLVGVCAQLQGHADAAGGLQADPLNLLEGDVRARVDGRLALDGTGTEEYADDVFYFHDAPHGGAFAQAWGKQNSGSTAPNSVSFCRWHVLGTELEFANSIELELELGGTGNPGIVDHLHSVAFVYLAD